MSKITAHDFAQQCGDFSFSGKTEDMLAGVDKLRQLLVDGTVVIQEVRVSSVMAVDDFVLGELTFKIAEKH